VSSYGSGMLGSWILALSLVVLTSSPAAIAQSQERPREVANPQGDLASTPNSTASVAPTPVREYRSEIERTWFHRGKGGGAGAVRVRALAFGIENLDSAARALIAAPEDGNQLGNAMLAARLAPDLPVAHLALARANWDEGNQGEALRDFIAAVRVVPRNLEASAWLTGSLFAIVAVVLLIAPVFFIAWVGLGTFGRSAHDLGDLVSKETPGFARIALPGILLLLPLLLGEGLGGALLILFALGMIYGPGGYRVALSMAAILLIIGLYPVTRLAHTALTALDADPVASAAFAVMQGNDSSADRERLESAAGEDFLAAHALALKARISGRNQEAVERYAALVAADPDQPVVLANYANLLFAAGSGEEAVEYYERAATSVDSARLMFDLSQVYASQFRIEEFESALKAAQSLDRAKVADLSRVGDGNFVADLPVPVASLRTRMLAAARAVEVPEPAVPLLFPGRLGASWLHSSVGFALAAIAGVFASRRFEHAGSCIRCRKRTCSRCDQKRAARDTCDACYHLFHRPETTDPTLRRARLEELNKHELLRGRLAMLASLLVPGAAGMLARRPDLGFLGILFFVSAGLLFYASNGVVADPLTLGGVGVLAFVTVGGLAALAYVIVVASGVSIRRSL
jgi:tetratricopeptide (TPR) repeat protein